MSQWSHEHPEQMEAIARLPPSQQNEALREAMPDPLAAADDRRKADLEDLARRFAGASERSIERWARNKARAREQEEGEQ